MDGRHTKTEVFLPHLCYFHAQYIVVSIYVINARRQKMQPLCELRSICPEVCILPVWYIFSCNYGMASQIAPLIFVHLLYLAIES